MLKDPTQADLPVKLFRIVGAWETWLSKNASRSKGLWLEIAKKGSSLQSLSYDEALEVALCYGWIDGQKKAFDSKSWLQRFTPRGPRSIWSKINCGKVERLIEEGRMQPSGLAAVDQAKANGEWERAYGGQRTVEPAEEFIALLAKRPNAKAFYETLNAQNRYAIHFRIHSAKKPETRRKRVEKFIEMLERQEKLYP
jgi:uncharacterized protein YdeI (YjbR/CyaY-like superfamily)